MGNQDARAKLNEHLQNKLPCMPASDAVELEGVKPHLLLYVATLGHIHVALFGTPLVIVSARDAEVGGGELHMQGRAVAVRITDLEEKYQILFLHVLSATAPEWQCCTLDRRTWDQTPHVCIHYQGE
jgi:hypothetical protein